MDQRDLPKLDKNFQPQGAPSLSVDDHEHSDVSVRGVVAFVLFLVVGGIFVFVGLYWMLRFLEGRHEQADRELQPATYAQVQQAPSAPTIPQTYETEQFRRGMQPSEVRELQQYEALQSKVKQFPEPRVQSDDIYDMALFRHAELAHLHCGQLAEINAQPSHGTQAESAAEGGEHGAAATGPGEEHGAAAPEPVQADPNCVSIDQAIKLISQRGLPNSGMQVIVPVAQTGGKTAAPSRSSTHAKKTVMETNTYGRDLLMPYPGIEPPE